MIPAMTTGIRDCRSLGSAWRFRKYQIVLQTFIIKSGLNVPTPAIPMPDLAVPYAAPAPAYTFRKPSGSIRIAVHFLRAYIRRSSAKH